MLSADKAQTNYRYIILEIKQKNPFPQDTTQPLQSNVAMWDHYQLAFKQPHLKRFPASFVSVAGRAPSARVEEA